MKFKIVLVLAALLGAFFSQTGSASAITNGYVDGTKHPQVGMVYAPWRIEGVKSPLCSGTLISSTVYLTAAHCFVGNLPSMTAHDVWVSFDSVRSDTPQNLHRGTFYIPEKYNSQHADVAVIKFDAPVTGITPSPLAGLNTLGLAQTAGTLKTQKFTAVGFGATDVVQGSSVLGDPNRRYSFGYATTLTTDQLKLSQLNNAKFSLGGTCYGDSGGPLYNPAGKIVGIISTGDANCTSTNVVFRVDTQTSRDFLKRFVTLP